MKYVVLIGDGMADERKAFPEGKTPLFLARKPNLDRLASCGVFGTVRTIPQGMHPGSDVANMSILGYDPAVYYTGRAPIEAAGAGVELADDETAFRCNLVTLREESGQLLMDDYSAGHITDDEAEVLIQALNENLGRDGLTFYAGVSYRNLCLIRNFDKEVNIRPPHDFMDQPVNENLPQGKGERDVMALVQASQKILAEHPVNEKRRAGGKKPANSIWLWGQGKRPSIPTLKDRAGVQGVVISGVDLVRGLGKLAGLEIIRVPGATAWIDTNYEGKVKAALEALKEQDFAYIHVEAPDEASHAGDLDLKIKAIELFDERVVGPMLEGLMNFDEFKLLTMPDHYTPLSTRSHSDDPVPFSFVTRKDLTGDPETNRAFTEDEAEAGGIKVEKGSMLLDRYFFQKGLDDSE
jgi:2,3-bisphosphoglycerate-independent phosphoglycerate mutase